MADRREHKRVKKRLPVEYGIDELDQKGMATDISVGGLFLECRRPPEIGTRLHMRVRSRELDFFAEGEVVRMYKVDPRFRRIKSEGVGIRFLSPAEIIEEAIPKSDRLQRTNTLVCETAEALRDVLQEQIYSRIIVVPVDEAPGAGEIVEFTVHVEMTSTEVSGQGRVLQVLGGEPQKVVLEIQDAQRIRAEIEAILTGL